MSVVRIGAIGDSYHPVYQDRICDEKPTFCPICGGMVDNGLSFDSELRYLSKGYTIKPTKPSHWYLCRNLRIIFCDDCLTGVGGVDIICKVIEASARTRAKVQADCDSIISKRKSDLNKRIRTLVVGIVIVAVIIGICCLIWRPNEVFTVLGIIAMIIIAGLIQGAARR